MIEMEWLLAYLALGSVVGFLAGLFGVGGGSIMVPILTTLFAMQGFPPEHMVHTALGTSMASIIITSVSSFRSHYRHGAVLWDVALIITPGIIIGTFGASFIAAAISPYALTIIFTLFMTYVAVRMLLDLKSDPKQQLPGVAGLSLAGTGIGAISALVAIGGGALTVPFLTWCNVKIQKAIGTSAAVGFPIAVAGTAGYIWNGWGIPGTAEWSLGYVYLPAVLAISIVSYATAPLGAGLAHKLPVGILKKLFALLLLLVCLKMLHTVYTA